MEIKKPVNTDFLDIGVTRFELAASASLRQRSNQTEPHPVNKGYYTWFEKENQEFFCVL